MRFEKRRYTSQDGLSLFFQDYGPRDNRKTPVLCLAGLTRNSNDFGRVAETMADRRRVICPDYRGRGLSDYDPKWRNYRPAAYLNDVRHLLTALNVHRVFVIGASMGGLLAMGMGAAMPTALAGALINDVGPEVETRGVDQILAYMQDGKDGFDTWKDAAGYLRSRFPALPAQTDDDWLWLARGAYREGKDGRIEHDWDDNLIRPILNDRETPNLWPLFRTLRGRPLAVTRGGVSDILSAATLRAMQAEIPELVARTIEGVGHMPSLLEPESQEALRHALVEADRAHY